MKYPFSLEKLIEDFEMFPGVGPKTAERLAFFTILNLEKEDVERFSKSLLNAKNELKYCSTCGSITDVDICDICSDQEREKKLIVVENTKDVITFEKTNQYKGRYHVLNGVISPSSGIGPNQINFDKLLERVEQEAITEVIIATSSSINGEITAMYINNKLKGTKAKVYRIGYGLPVGADIEYTDEITLIKALEGKKEI
ncbi:MAG: recombination mediator RecR [Bacilli bacterium]|nr:recombination mediator RecR [Bacilli bacterium]